MWDEIRKMKPIERRPDGELFRLTPKQAHSVWRLVKLCLKGQHFIQYGGNKKRENTI